MVGSCVDIGTNTKNSNSKSKKMASRRSRSHLCYILGGLIVVFLCLSNLSISIDECSMSASQRQSYCATQLSGSVLERTEAVNPTQLSGSVVKRTKRLVHQSLLPSQPDKGVEERLKLLTRANVELAEIVPLNNCSATSQVRILNYSDGSLKLVSLDIKGQNKTIGGDEYLVTYTDASSERTTLVAFVHDNVEGTYSLDFSTTPMNPVSLSGYGNLTVHLQYTCGIGAMGQPLKDNWVTGATCGTTWILGNIPTPSYRIFSPPTDAGIDFSPYSMVIGYGDSITQGLFRYKSTNRDPRMHLYRQNTTDLTFGLPGLELQTETVDDLVRTLHQWHGHQLNQSNVALVVGSAVWDLLSKDTVDPHFAIHLEGARQYVKRLQQEYPNVSLYWRSASAFQPQILPNDCFRYYECVLRTRYMSNSRARILYEKQKSLMTELGIPFLDLWEAYYLSGDRMLKRADGRHYDSALNILMQSWFYRGD
jgi:hypothetical protein